MIKLDLEYNVEPDPPPTEANCLTCGENFKIYHWENGAKKGLPICGWCMNRGRQGSCRQPPQDAFAYLGFEETEALHKAHAVYVYTQLTISNIKYQRKTGKQGEHIKWNTMTREQRTKHLMKPAPARAYMP